MLSGDLDQSGWLNRCVLALNFNQSYFEAENGFLCICKTGIRSTNVNNPLMVFTMAADRNVGSIGRVATGSYVMSIW